MPSKEARTLIVHAGLPKTGTTYLQRSFHARAPWLAQHGVLYPAPAAGQWAHHEVAARLASGGEIAGDGEAAAVAAAIAGDSPRVLLSSEAFSALPPQGVAALAAAAGGRTVRWVLFLRRRSDIAYSRWQETVKHGNAETFMEFVAAQLCGEGDVLRPADCLIAAAAALGVAALQVAIYDEVARNGEDLFAFFCRAHLGLCYDGPAAPLENAGHSPSLTEAIRALNAAYCIEQGVAAADLAFATAAEHALQVEPWGQQFLAEVAQLYDAHGRPLQVEQLDDYAQVRDAQILHYCRSQIVNLPADGSLFGPARPRLRRCLPPDRLYRAIPTGVIAQVTQRVAAAAASS